MISDTLRILMYHRVAEPRLTSGGDQSIISATPESFDRQMQTLARRYRVVSAEQVLDSIRGKQRLPRRAVWLTFDDAYNDFGECAWPIMRRYRLAATLFVPTAFIDDRGRRFWWDRLAGAMAQTSRDVVPAYGCGALSLRTSAHRRASLRTLKQHLNSMPHDEAMSLVDRLCGDLGEPEHPVGRTHSWDELRLLAADGVTMAAHTRNHPALTRLSPERARAEIRGSQEDLQRELGNTLPIFSYPFGDHNEAVVQIAREAGFEVAVTCRAGHNNRRGPAALRLRRTDITLRTTQAIFMTRLTTVGSWLDRSREAYQKRGVDRSAGSVATADAGTAASTYTPARSRPA